TIREKTRELSKEIERYRSEIEDLENKILTFKPDYTYSELYQNVILEKDSVLLSSNRMTYNSYLSKKIESAYLFNDYSHFILFKMKDQHVHTVIIDEQYNFGGCSLPNDNMTHKRLNGEKTPIDEMIWQIQQNFLILIESCKGLNDNKLDNYLKRISKLISKIIVNQEIELFNQVLFQIEKAHTILEIIQTKNKTL
ncbi:TPA: recombinase family protein, partial [Vibrio parahaemolyticus]|nr:recombinase family protein [Vibrio parahaemolyticus]